MTTLQLFPATLDALFTRCTLNLDTGCWLWGGARDRLGYGRVPAGRRGTTFPAHRLAYVYAKGSIPKGMQIDHLCRNKSCINPRHLEAVTPSENVRRGVGPQKAAERMTARFVAYRKNPRTHCKRGHEMTPENTIIEQQKRDGRPTFKCRECKRASLAAWTRAHRRKYKID